MSTQNDGDVNAGMLVHLSTNLWNDSPTPLVGAESWEPFSSDTLRFDRELWLEMSQRMADAGFRYVLWDLGDGVQWESHPEIAVEGAWTPGEMRDEIARLRAMGIQSLPKLNFSTAHDAWMGMYSRRVSTPEYYAFCRDLITEAADLFDGPALFHIGMDEETLEIQRNYPYVVLRQYEHWWHDLAFYAEAVESTGARPWMWSDYGWTNPEFFARASTNIVQSNWHYAMNFEGDESGRPHAITWPLNEFSAEGFLTYLDLQDGGFDQVPTTSTWVSEENFAATVEFCGRRLEPASVLGFLQTTWKRMTPEFRDDHLRAIDAVGRTL